MNYRSVRTHHVPGNVSTMIQSQFLEEIKRADECDRPCFVLDCSSIKQMDAMTVQLLLSCLEHVMKCNGDVRLAGLKPEAEHTLISFGADRLFERYSTTAAAVASFSGRRMSMMPVRNAEERYEIEQESAA